MATAGAGGVRRSPEHAAAHKAAYFKGLNGEPAGEAETNDPKLRRSYREGLKASRGEVPPRKSAQPKPAKPATPAPVAAAKSEPEDTSETGAAKSRPGKGFSAAPPVNLRRISASSGGFVLGMMAYALAINYVRYGMPGVKAFLQAKAFNKVTPGPWSSSSSGAPASPGVGEGPGQLPFYLVPPAKASA